MTTIITRAGKGTSLSWTEADANFTNLNTDKLEASALAPYETSAHASSTYKTITSADATYATIVNTVSKDSSTGSARIPAGTTAQRTGSPTDGNFRYNSTLQSLESYYSSKWNPLLPTYVNVKEYGATGDGTTDDTSAINSANTAATALGKTLFFPAGTYIATNIPAIAKMNWLGEGPINTILKLKNGTNADFITSSSNIIDDVSISGIQFHGNYQNNTSGDTLTIKGARTTITNVIVSFSAGTAITTDWDNTEAGRDLSFLSTFDHILIFKSQKHGWVHNGPSDCHFNNIEIVDAGLLTTNAYYGLYLANSGGHFGNARLTNVHYWNESGTTNIPASGVYVESVGNNFINCHFEGSTLPLNIVGSGNTFSSCSYYAPRGSYVVNIASTAIGTILEGSFGLTTFGTNYAGVFLASSNCILNITNIGSGCVNGVVDFSSSLGQNVVKALGYQSTGVIMLGTPHVTDDVLIEVSGAAGGVFQQTTTTAWKTYTPTVTSISGTLTTVSATGRYKKIGNIVHIQVTSTITTNGTGSGGLNITIPFVSGASSVLAGRETSAGKMLQGNINSGSGVMSVFDYANTYPGGSGTSQVLSGIYESV